MKPMLIKHNKVDFVKFDFQNKNDSGYTPIGDRVLVAIDRASSISAGGIHITPELEERMTMAAEIGTFIASGEGAFKFHPDGTPFVGRTPKPGDRVFLERYAGQVLTGTDGKPYRIMDHKCIGAIQEEV